MIAYSGHERYHRKIQEIFNKELDNYDEKSVEFLSTFLSRFDEISEEIISVNSSGGKESGSL